MSFAYIDAHRQFIFKVDPYNISWGYNLRTQVTDTYGGKVVQILGVELTNLTIETVAGGFGYPYLTEMKDFFREMGRWQQETQTPATFNFPPKGYVLKFWGQKFQYQDSVDNVVFPVQITGMIQEDLAGTLKKSIMTDEIKKLSEGIGYVRNKFNDPDIGNANTTAYNTLKSAGTSDPITGQIITQSSQPGAVPLSAAAFAGGKWGPENPRGNAVNTDAAIAYVKSAFGISDIGGWSASGSVSTSDHPKGKALDCMIPNYKSPDGIAKGTAIADWFINNPNAFGTKYVIWRDRINQNGTWTPYQHPSGGNDDTLQHRDHVHISLLTGPSPG